MTERFEQWCILEIFGHQKYAGLVTEQTIGGASFIRIDVPAVGECAPFSKLFGASSIYALTPVTEEIARGVAASLKQQPLGVWDIPEAIRAKYRAQAPALTAPVGDYDDDDFEDDPWDYL